MAEKVGGLWIKSYELTRSWGIEPASASGVGVLGAGEIAAGIAVGEFLAFSFGAIVFYGIVSSAQESTERESGHEYPFSLVDSRVWLGWGQVFGQWNMPEDPDIVHADPFPLPAGDAIDQMSGDRVGFDAGVDFTGGLDGGQVGFDNGVNFGDGAFPDEEVLASGLDPSSISRGRLYGHIRPEQWGAQLKTYTPAPLSAARILAEAFAKAVGGRAFALNFHSSQNKPVFNVDANSGMSLAALVSMMCDAQGLQVTLDGQRTLRFARRGGGVVIPPVDAYVMKNGFSISSEPTRVRVIGDRVLVQMNSIDLEPDWRSPWEQFVNEPAWLAEVERVIENDLLSPTISDDNAGRAELAARAREMTVAQYIQASGSTSQVEGATNNFSDYGRWGKVSRMDIPAWVYINSIVYRSYRIPDETLIFGLPMRSMEIHESMLCAVEITGDGDSTAIQYRQNPVEFYPPGQAYVIAKGQPLDLLSAADREAIVRLRIKDMRTQWSEIADFTVDVNNRSIRFASPVFTDGDPEQGKSILSFTNKGEGGCADLSSALDAKSDYLRVCVPNPDNEITAASVRCALVFKLGKTYKDFGSGPKWKPEICSSIAEHLLDPSGGSLAHDQVAAYTGVLRMPNPLGQGLKEILYDNGQTAIKAAKDQADGLIFRNGVEQAGSYRRVGAFGTSLSGGIDRVTIKIDRENGLVEEAEFRKPRPTRGFVSSRENAQRVKSEELFDGQQDLSRKVAELKAISKLQRLSINDSPRSTSHVVLADVFKRPFGSETPACATLADPASAWPTGRTDSTGNAVTGWRAGDLLWLDDAGLPSKTGKTFGGVVVSNSHKVSGTPVKYITVCTDGTTPCACAPGLSPSAALMATPGDWKCTAAGTYPIGMLGHHSNVPGSGAATLALVRLNAGGSGGAVASYIPWEPNFFTAGTTTTPIYKCRFNLGTVNDVPASNWNDEHVLSMAADAFSFVVLTITTGSGKVTTVNLSVDTAAPVEDSIASGTPPVTFKIVLGAIGRSTAKMIVNKNIELSATEVFRESKTAPATGQEPFTRWWRWGNR